MKEYVNINGKNVLIFNNNCIVEEIEKHMGHDFSAFIRNILDNAEESNRLAELKFNSDFEVYEAENESFRDTLNEISSIVQQYQYNVEHKNEPFSRKKVFPLLEKICDLVNEVV